MWCSGWHLIRGKTFSVGIIIHHDFFWFFTPIKIYLPGVVKPFQLDCPNVGWGETPFPHFFLDFCGKLSPPIVDRGIWIALWPLKKWGSLVYVGKVVLDFSILPPLRSFFLLSL